MKVRFDPVTEKYLKNSPYMETTLCQCDKCGLYYKPSLGHKCKKKEAKE